MDILVVVLMVLVLLLFIGSRYQLKRTGDRVNAHDYMKEMRAGILEYRIEGRTRAQIIDAIMNDYGLEQHEAEYMHDRVQDNSE